MSQPDVRIDTEALRSHARMVDEAASMCDEAVAAGRYRNVLRLESFRLETAGTGGSGWSGFKGAYNLLGEGHVSVYSTADKVAGETARSASRTNSAQNAGAAGSTLTGDNPSPPPIELPL